jgi:hypothetical protein
MPAPYAMQCSNRVKNKQAYRNVYIDNDLPVETRMFQGNIRTLLKEIGKENEMVFVGNKPFYI